jgi:hypothetical protein
VQLEQPTIYGIMEKQNETGRNAENKHPSKMKSRHKKTGAAKRRIGVPRNQKPSSSTSYANYNAGDKQD